jgi:flagellar assembly protein FliH
MIEKEAYEKAYVEGERAGREIGEKKLASILSGFRAIVAELEKIKKDFYLAHQENLLQLSLHIAKKIIHQEVSTNGELVIEVVRSALQCAIDREKLKIRLNPSDLQLCREKRPDILKGFDDIKQIVFEPDENVSKGGTIIESDLGEIDARLERQFEKVGKELMLSHRQREQTF